MHRIEELVEAEEKGKSIFVFTEEKEKYKEYIEDLMQYEIPELDIPDNVQITQLTNGRRLIKQTERIFIEM